ncbi:CD209 antigen-like protein E [Danio aesculapii]|uniref:CD209 antigen-like protein E n=1 Tax=Danio aesculapii TaxID=1142201 RepID=UPI0024C070E8|nr:CD209 antigen-like protein E [Danio aesculapii]
MSRENRESICSIYENIMDNKDLTRNEITARSTMEIQTSELTESDSGKMRKYRAAIVCLVLLCFLLLAAATVLSVIFTLDRQQLISMNENLTRVNNQLTLEKNILQKSLSKIDGWIFYQSSFYLVSSEKKSWNESRTYCKDKGTDLLIVNNLEEQSFLRAISYVSYFWIGLSDQEVEGKWIWVDGSSPSFGFNNWASGEPNSNAGNEDCALVYPSGWADYPCNFTFNWICEETIFI